MNIREITSGLTVLGKNRQNGDCEVRGLAADSRHVRPGYVFFALPGANTDGHLFLNEAIDRGAVLVVIQDRNSIPEIQDHVPYILVSNVREAMAHISTVFYGHPSRKMHVVGITGTNGKTTTCFLLHSIFEEGGWPCGLLTTVKNLIGNEEYESVNTTEDALSVSSRLDALLKKGIRHTVMEVSSHGLALGRVAEILFDTAVVTNLVSEHLEFHGTYDHYFASKKKLLSMVEANREKTTPPLVVANGDDPEVMRMAGGYNVPLITFGIERGVDVRAVNPKHAFDRTEFTVQSPWGTFPLQISQPGLHNVYNALGAVSVALFYGLTQETIARGLALTPRVPGRWERVRAGQDFEIIVDFAHNWHALEKSLSLVRNLTSGKIISVFGCGGERDKRKRPLMGEAVARWSDLCILTTDNPRHEDPMSTINDALEGVCKKAGVRAVEYRAIVDRREAIRQALQAAGPGDIVFLAGKGPERSQIFADYSINHNDLEIVRSFIQEGIHAVQTRRD
ncbi:MAG TPA: UDP-N-acetylmuramoyl-L-alanyl-D-glutamate--2,6-diaminopimelate ligase [Atribacteraceae bacterium]|nr:UDP-N-acetylmuramoyl-L-alanyl-D-glutamate--2,6-diaminopimelate ligase [Atribacteraceae bacterium]